MSLRADIVFLGVQVLRTKGYALLGLRKVDVLMDWAVLHGTADLETIKDKL